tara:strand:+ start:74 stop:250 length:177 start_codon:yes stop_codon:yes gene_type:complete
MNFNAVVIVIVIGKKVLSGTAVQILHLLTNVIATVSTGAIQAGTLPHGRMTVMALAFR